MTSGFLKLRRRIRVRNATKYHRSNRRPLADASPSAPTTQKSTPATTVSGRGKWNKQLGGTRARENEWRQNLKINWPLRPPHPLVAAAPSPPARALEVPVSARAPTPSSRAAPLRKENERVSERESQLSPYPPSFYPLLPSLSPPPSPRAAPAPAAGQTHPPRLLSGTGSVFLPSPVYGGGGGGGSSGGGGRRGCGVAMNSGGGLPPPSAAASPSSSSLAAAVAVVAPPGVGGVPGGVAAGVKLKYCRYYAKDKTCFYGEECQFLHEDPAAGAVPGLSLHSNSVPLALAGAPVAGFPPGAVPGGGAGPPPGPKKPDLGDSGAGGAAGGGGSSGGLDGPRLASECGLGPDEALLRTGAEPGPRAPPSPPKADWGDVSGGGDEGGWVGVSFPGVLRFPSGGGRR
ncbi:hypothetical protein P7K49_012384 [Saguinus oedipus]|uniref:C3H1-type domain-containing protein n=1 Tax=Saguinus oedipus TaxID=9490 RepID=A0ABQ9VTF1_SAGOE|nr:hypothetical protein P7K49_012384 [Saguinus oedipus]